MKGEKGEACFNGTKGEKVNEIRQITHCTECLHYVDISGYERKHWSKRGERKEG